MKKLLIALALGVAGIGAVPVTATAATTYVRVAPPAPRDEVVPAARPGYVWTPGYWDYRSRRHVWVNGTWVRERRGYVYAHPNWVEHDGRWQLQRGRWNRGDRDHDGIPNSLDHHPDNPRRP